MSEDSEERSKYLDQKINSVIGLAPEPVPPKHWRDAHPHLFTEAPPQTRRKGTAFHKTRSDKNDHR